MPVTWGEATAHDFHSRWGSAVSSRSRLYELTLKDQRNGAGLLVEAFAADEQLLGVGGVR